MNKIKQVIANIRGSQDGRILASNFGYLMLLQITSYVFPLLTIPYLARVIGVDGFGKIAFAAAVIVWFQTISDWGFNYTATRDVAKNRDDLEKVSRIFSNVLWARLLLMLISFVLLYTLTEITPYFKENQVILLVTFLLVPGHIMFPDWFFQAMERMKYITIFNLISKILFTILVFLLIKEKQDYIIQPLLMSLGYLISGVVAMYIILAKWKVRLYAPRWKSIKQVVAGSADVFVNNISRNLYNSFSVVLLGFFGGSYANGILDAGRKFVSIAQSFSSVIDRAFFPFLSRKLDYHSRYAVATLTTVAVGVVSLIVIAPYLIKIVYTEEFLPAVPILQFMATSLLFTTLNSVYGTNFLIISGDTRLMRNITLYVSVVGFVTAFPLVYFLGYWGAAINIVGAQLVLGVSMMVAVKRINKRENM